MSACFDRIGRQMDWRWDTLAGVLDWQENEPIGIWNLVIEKVNLVSAYDDIVKTVRLYFFADTNVSYLILSKLVENQIDNETQNLTQ